MANTIKDYVASSVTTSSVFTTPSYLTGRGATDIQVAVDGAVKTLATDYVFTGTDSAAITFVAGKLPTDGQKIRITRSSSQNTRLTDYTDGALLTADALDADANQLFYVAQEAIDVASETNLAAGTFYFSQGTAPSTPVAGTLWYDTTTSPNVLKVYNGTGWELTAPTRATATFGQSDFTAYSGSTLHQKTNTGYNNTTLVFLNGVKLVKAAVVGDIPANGDYFYEASTDRLWLQALSTNDVLTLETYGGSFSSAVSTSEANAAASATAASNSASTASGWASTAGTKATQAAASATSASGAASSAQSFATSASSSASSASGAASAASTSANTATAAASTATTKATEAANSATTAATAATNATNTVNTVSADVATVAGISSEVSTVANATYKAKVEAVAGDATDIGTVATNITNVNAVAGVSSDVATVANSTYKTKVETVADDLNGSNTIGAAVTSASNAASSAALSATNANNAAGSAGTASTRANQAAASATAAAASASTATIQASTATAQASSASGSASTATSEKDAAIAANNAAVTAKNEAVTAKNEAVTAKDLAVTSKNNAATSASSAASSESNAATSATNAAVSETNAAASYDSFDDRYLGVKSSAPSTDNDGGALLTGALYFNSTSNTMFVFTGSAWAAVANNNIINPNVALTQDLATNGNDIKFGDDDKATFGVDDDLQIYHDGSNSYIDDAGAGALNIRSNGLFLEKYTGEVMVTAIADGAVTLYHDNALKLATTSTGIDVTGEITADGLTVDSTTGFSWLPVSTAGAKVGAIGTGTGLIINTPSVNAGFGSGLAIDGSYASSLSSVNIKAFGAKYGSYGSELNLFTSDDTSLLKRQTIASNGDISFYEDTGTTPKLFWDASAESLGIGTSSPSSYDFNDPAKLVVANTGNSTLSIASGSSSIGYLAFADGTSGTSRYAGSVQYNHSTNVMSMHTTDGSERMRIDASGNVGIGTSSPSSQLHISSTGATTATIEAGGGGDAVLDIKAAEANGGESIIRFSDSVSGVGFITYAQNDGGSDYMRFGTASTERMRIDSSGNLLVGKTGASVSTAGAELRADGQISSTRSGDTPVFINRLTNDGKLIDFRKDNTTVGSIGTANGDAITIGNSTGNLILWAANVAPASTASGGASDGVVNLGTSARRFKDLHLSGYAYVGALKTNSSIESASNLTFWVPNVGEAVRIEANTGNLLVGTTDVTPGQNDTNVGTSISNAGRLMINNAGADNIMGRNTDGVLLSIRKAGEEKGSITVSSTATTYNTSSDQRLKENIADADDAGSKIDAIQVRKYDWKADGSHQDYGMVAQELQAVAPEAVSGDADSEEMMGVDYSKLVPMLIKEIQSLRNRVAQLEE